jgi:signal transduction histidine kinase
VLQTGVPLVKENQQGARWLHVVKVPVSEGRKSVWGLVCSGRDITQLKQVQEQLTHAQKMESVGRLAAGVAHEINTPLGVILGYAQLLLEDVEPQGQVHDDVATIVRQTKICSKIVADLLKFSRPGKRVIQRFDVNLALREVVEMVEHTFGLSHVKIVQQFSRQPLSMWGDEEKIKQVFVNLLNNAFDAIGEDGSIHVRTAPGRTPDKIEISIADTGCGIAPKEVSKIFEPFYTTKGPDRGTGLGLSVTFGIIQEHKGSIKVFSPPVSMGSAVQGAQFVVKLPAGLSHV